MLHSIPLYQLNRGSTQADMNSQSSDQTNSILRKGVMSKEYPVIQSRVKFPVFFDLFFSIKIASKHQHDRKCRRKADGADDLFICVQRRFFPEISSN